MTRGEAAPAGPGSRWRDDSGTTLLEVVVAMGIMTIFMVVFTAATLAMTGASNTVLAVSDAADQGNTAFLALEREVRYATGISTPKRSAAGTWHVEIASREQVDAGGTDVCTQLRVANNQLQRREWTVSNGTGTVTSDWRPLASKVTNGTAATGSGNEPFAVPAATAGSSSTFQRLTVLTVTTGGPAGSTSAHRTTTTFTALNSDAGTDPATVCNQSVGVLP